MSGSDKLSAFNNRSALGGAASGLSMANRVTAIGYDARLINFLAIFGGKEAMVEELNLKTLPAVRMLQARPDGGMGVVK
jgi:hypothetical protein